MQVVIEIPEEKYMHIKEKQWLPNRLLIEKAIANGTPLPKGHGRLIDANILEECKEMVDTIMGECIYAVRMDEIRNIPTIIEADKEKK